MFNKEILYDPTLPYHNYEHVLKTLKHGEEIMLHCRQAGLVFNEIVVKYAIPFHDAGYSQNHLDLGFKTKEEYSAYLAGESLKDENLSQAEIDQIKACIISTNTNQPFTTIEEKIVRAADLAGLASSYEEFLDANLRLKQEFELLNHRPMTISERKEQAKKLIEFYLSQDIHLTPYYYDENGNSVFHTRTQANLDRFLLQEFT